MALSHIWHIATVGDGYVCSKTFAVAFATDLKEWIAGQALANVSSQNSEIIRAIRERMERAAV